MSRLALAVVRRVQSSAAIAATVLVLPAQAVHHVRGPGELLPPNLAGAPPAAQIEVDLTEAAFWWAFHADSLLPPHAVRSLSSESAAAVVDALLAAAGAAEDELAWQSLWALARAARQNDAAAVRLRRSIDERRLLGRDGVLGEVAAVALGLAAHGDDKAMAGLAALAGDASRPQRLRAFAFYGLGLAAQDAAATKAQFRVLSAVERALLPESGAEPELRIAALHALSMMRIDVSPSLAAPALALLERVWAPEGPPGLLEPVAHVPPAVAALLAPDDARAEVWRERFAAAAIRTRSNAVSRSTVRALGALCRPWDGDDSPDARYAEKLRELAGDHRDLQTRYYALVAMGESGGARHRSFLLQQFQRARMLERPWVAFGLAASTSRAGSGAAEVAAAIAAAAGAIKAPNVRAALAFAERAVRGQPWLDHDSEFEERYALRMPGAGADDARAARLVATLGDAKQPLAQRCIAAAALGQLADGSPRHWSAKLAAAVDYRGGTPVLLGLPNGVLRLP